MIFFIVCRKIVSGVTEEMHPFNKKLPAFFRRTHETTKKLIHFKKLKRDKFFTTIKI